MEKLVYNGKGAIFGRMATVIAKNLLKGDSVDLINCGEIIISGDKNLFAKKIQAKRNMGRGGSLKGPKYIRQPDRLVKRMIRGMLPRDRWRGQDAFKRLRCHIGNGNLDEDILKCAKGFNHNIPRKFSTIKEIIEVLK
jgi:large subunit ribosomal protein L13